MASYHCTIMDALEVTYIYCVCVMEILGKGVSSASLPNSMFTDFTLVA